MHTRKSVSGLLILTLLTTAACGNLAVPPPFEEAERGWEIKPGSHVVIKTKAGEEIRGEVDSVDEAGFVIEGKRVERNDIREMWMEPESVVGSVVRMLAIATVFVGLFVAFGHWAASHATLY